MKSSILSFIAVALLVIAASSWSIFDIPKLQGHQIPVFFLTTVGSYFLGRASQKREFE